MQFARPRLRSIAWHGFWGWFSAVVTIVAALMTTTKIRKMLRGGRHERFPVTAPTTVEVADTGPATVYTYGEDLYEDMLAAIDSAQVRILLETYILKSDAVGGRFKDALVAAADRGVDVHVVYDGFANLVVRPSFFRFPPPVQVLRYPVFQAGWKFFNPRQWGRDHRKILVVDDRVGFTGGFNIGADGATRWRDTHVRVEGSAVWDLDNAFIDFWNMRRDERRHSLLENWGQASWAPHVRAHRNVPQQLIFPIRGIYLEAIDRASEHIRITAAYFIPDHNILEALKAARERGVEVELLVPEVSNHVVADWLSRGFYGELLRSGVRIHRYQDAMVHAKTMTIDGRWSTVGTANIDRLSLTGNYEINLEFIDEGLAAHLELVFATDLTNCQELTLAQWQRRPVVARTCEILLRPLRPLL